MAEWGSSMDSLRPPTYVCLRRKARADGSFEPMIIDGRVSKDDWEHAPWTDVFVDIEGPERKPDTNFQSTRVKMMYDDDAFYVAAELMETQIWGTIKKKNSTMYHENDFEVFLDPDGSRHNYYELEVNCLNTIWELLLHKPYKDGYSIENPYNLSGVRTAVYIDGVTNSPQTVCTKWCVEMAFPLGSLVQFDRLRGRRAAPGDVWRVNFSRVQYQLETVVDQDTGELQYEKRPHTKEDNIVWAPTGVIDIHRPEKWGVVFFSSQDELPGGEDELSSAMEGFLREQLVMERVLDTIYYDQRAYYADNECFASSMEELYPRCSFPHQDLIVKHELSPPLIRCDLNQLQQSQPNTSRRGSRAIDDSKESKQDEATRRRRSYAPKLDPEEDEEDNDLRLLTPRSRAAASQIFAASVRSATQEWLITHDGRLVKLQDS